jgi:hypothetical protein
MTRLSSVFVRSLHFFRRLGEAEFEPSTLCDSGSVPSMGRLGCSVPEMANGGRRHELVQLEVEENAVPGQHGLISDGKQKPCATLD